jgi:primosomal protein N' (replication factor Y)
VVDEEHEPSYKQDAEVWGSYKIFYDARATARKLAELVGGVVVLGSATPSLESYFAAQQGALALLTMPRRVLGHGVAPAAGGADAPIVPVAYSELPPVEVVDMRLELRAGNRSILSRSLQSELHTTLDAGQQAILFLNRRGSNTFVMCRDCGNVQECPRCDVPLTYHERASQLICHHCSRRYPIPEICPNCQSKRIRYFGSGTQRIEDLVHEFAPRARVLRWDADTARSRGGHEAILQQFANHEADVLVGTQMIAKGLDLPLVTLVGVVAADVGLYLPDFRSGERTFQLLTQVAGRAGRSRHAGRVVIQTYTPDHYVIQAAAQHDYTGFYRREVGYRQEYGYPPLRRMARLVYWEKKADKAQAAAEEMSAMIRSRLHDMGLGAADASLIGPAPAFFARFRGFYRWQLLLLTADPAAVLRRLTIPFGWRVDVDPVSVL